MEQDKPVNEQKPANSCVSYMETSNGPRVCILQKNHPGPHEDVTGYEWGGKINDNRSK